MPYAEHFQEILPALKTLPKLQQHVDALIQSDTLQGKVLEGGERTQSFRKILSDLVNHQVTLEQAYLHTAQQLPPYTSPHSRDKRVFCSRWNERLVRTQLSRFYTQAVLESLLASGIEQCTVPHSPDEEASSPCSRHLAGHTLSVQNLYDLLIQGHRHNRWTRQPMIPDHPNCTHVVAPLKDF